MNTVSPTLLDQWIAFEIVERDSGQSSSGDPADAEQQLMQMVKQWQK
jgi:hypothetical protein